MKRLFILLAALLTIPVTSQACNGSYNIDTGIHTSYLGKLGLKNDFTYRLDSCQPGILVLRPKPAPQPQLSCRATIR
ncbi:hypothetical protein A3841_08540 [Pontibacter flavimaris]|uniref:Uncharacterized protein n=1 Tax=Pontibacter flavimaris TaxID=1797110 RepID=A0A1Q5PIJ2_9BACT|nr:hypothetical protein A3841_08540 [Pontibacter flavimaris]